MHYLAIIGDIIDSRKILERKATQQRLQILIEKINSTYSKQIKAKFLITAGDEIQGLVYNDFPWVKCMAELLDECYPVKFRFGIGIGEITTSFNEYAIGMDGPAFHNARNAIDKLKDTKDSALLFNSPYHNPHTVLTINTLCGSLFLSRKLWTEKFKKYAYTFRQGNTQREIANQLNVSQSAISLLAKNSGWRHYLQLERDTSNLVQLYVQQEIYAFNL